MQEKELEKIKKQKEREEAAAEKKLKRDKDKEASLKRKAEEKAEKAAAAASAAANPENSTASKKRKRFTSNVLDGISTDDFAALQAVVKSEWPCPIAKCDNVKELVDGICASYGARAMIARLRKGAAKKVLDAQKGVSCPRHTCMSACIGLGDR